MHRHGAFNIQIHNIRRDDLQERWHHHNACTHYIHQHSMAAGRHHGTSLSHCCTAYNKHDDVIITCVMTLTGTMTSSQRVYSLQPSTQYGSGSSSRYLTLSLLHCLQQTRWRHHNMCTNYRMTLTGMMTSPQQTNTRDISANLPVLNPSYHLLQGVYIIYSYCDA